MKADLRISIKDYRRTKNLKVLLQRVPFATSRQFWVRMNGLPWPQDGRPVSLTRVVMAQVCLKLGTGKSPAPAGWKACAT